MKDKDTNNNKGRITMIILKKIHEILLRLPPNSIHLKAKEEKIFKNFCFKEIETTKVYESKLQNLYE